MLDRFEHGDRHLDVQGTVPIDVQNELDAAGAAFQTKDEAKETFLEARHFWNKRTPDDLKRSIEYFHRAIERDPDYPFAWTGLADVHTMIGIFGLQAPSDVFSPAKAAAERALSPTTRSLRAIRSSRRSTMQTRTRFRELSMNDVQVECPVERV